MKDLNKKLENDLKEKESLIDEEKTKTNAIKELLKEQEEQNNKLNIKIQQLEKTIEELQKELIKYKDNMFLTNVDIKKTPNKSDKNNEKYNEEIEKKDDIDLNKKNENEDINDLIDIHKSEEIKNNKESKEYIQNKD